MHRLSQESQDQTAPAAAWASPLGALPEGMKVGAAGAIWAQSLSPASPVECLTHRSCLLGLALGTRDAAALGR